MLEYNCERGINLKHARLVRLAGLIDYITKVPGMNYQYYASKLGVSARTIRRDVDVLEEAYFPIERSAGIRFISKVKLPEVSFSYHEALSLMVALGELKRYAEFDGILEKVKEKVAATLPDRLSEIVQEIEKRVGIYPSTGKIAARVSDKFNSILSCILDNRSVKINYKSRKSGKTFWRKVDPYGIFFRRRGWYLVAYCHEVGKRITFRFSRILELEHMKKSFKLPADFDLDSYVMESWELMKGEPAEIEVKFSPRVGDLIIEAVFHEQEEKELLEDGSVLYKIRAQGWKEVFFWILSYGGDAEIISPKWIRDRAREEAEKMMKNYQN